jgi:hypothetical protein
MDAEFFCNLDAQYFTRGFNFAGLLMPILTAGDGLPSRFYLVRNNPYGLSRFPFIFDDNSGKSGVTATASLLATMTRNDGTSYLSTLSGPLSLDPIRDGFKGILDLATSAIASFLTSETRGCVLSIDLTDGDGNILTPFRSAVTLRQATPGIGASPSTPIPGTVTLHSLTGFIGGTSVNVDGQVQTVGKTLGTLYLGVVNDVLYTWELRAGSGDSGDDNDAPRQIKPTDYNASTNARVLILVSG